MKNVTSIFESDSTTANVYGLWQWDYGQILRIQGLHLPYMVEIHFSLQETGGTSVSRIGVTKDGVTEVPIPDSMLENAGTANTYYIYAFIFLTDATSGQTEYKIKLQVKSRPKPEIPGGGEDPDIFHEAVRKVAESADQAAESERQAEGWAHGRENLPERAQDNAKYYAGKAAEDAKKTGADRKEVERLVESVSGIDQQVEKVEELTKQAQGAADKAGKSEQASKDAQKLAESAKAAAETAADKTAEDRTAVDNAKAEVLKAEESVSGDRAAVESTKKEIDQLKDDIPTEVQDGVQKVNDARDAALGDISKTGTDHKTAVESAGAKAVETITRTQTEAVGAVNTAKTKAVEAVEIAKTGAVKAVQTEGTTQTGNVTAEGQKQVKAVEDKGQEVLQSIPEDFHTQMESKLDKQQGMKNAGKALVIGEDGNVIPGKPQTEETGDTAPGIILEMSGDVIAANNSSDRVFQGMKIFGKSSQNTAAGEISPDHPVEIESVGTKGMIRVNVFGANIINFPEGEVKNNGITYTSSKGAVTVVGTTGSSSSQTDTGILTYILPKLKGVFYLSGRTKNVNVNIKKVCADGTIKYFGSGKITLDGDEQKVIMYIKVDSNKSVNETIYPMINAGDTPLPWEPFKSSPELQIPTPDGIPGIPVSSDENYMDSNGQKWVCDTLDLAQGVRINRLKKASLVNRPWLKSSNNRFYTPLNDASKNIGHCLVLCSCYQGTGAGHQLSNNNQISLYRDSSNTYPKENWLYIRDDTVSTPEEMQQKMNQLNAEIIYITANPTETILSQEIMDAYKSLHTHYPVTTITNDAGTGMKVKYVADTKNFILKMLEETNKMIVNTQRQLL